MIKLENSSQKKSYSINYFPGEKIWAGTFLRGAGDLEFPSEQVARLNQTHSDHIAWVSRESFPGREIADTDAVITQDRGVVLTIRTADCAPVFIFDPDAPVIALIHAGWRGARLGIVRKTVQALCERTGTAPGRLQAAIGPAIRACCYEFDTEEIPEFKPHMTRVRGKFHFDLAGYLRDELAGCGVGQESLFDSGLCTYCNPDDFFSYRREKAGCGRMVSYMMMRGEK